MPLPIFVQLDMVLDILQLLFAKVVIDIHNMFPFRDKKTRQVAGRLRMTPMIYRRLLLALGLLCFWAEWSWAEPFKTDWLKIPGNVGMEWFYGYWIPPGQHNLDVYGSILVEPGKIIYEENQHNNPTAYFRIVETTEQYVLALSKVYHDSFDRDLYFYSVFFPYAIAVPGKTVFNRFYWGDCSDLPRGQKVKRESFGLELWQAPIEEVRAHWASFGHCNPNVKGGRAEKLFYQREDPVDKIHPWLGGKVWGWSNFWRDIGPECKSNNRKERAPWCG